MDKTNEKTDLQMFVKLNLFPTLWEKSKMLDFYCMHFYYFFYYSVEIAST